MIFGWRISAFGPPIAFIAGEWQRPNTPVAKDDLGWPFVQQRKLKPNEEHLSLDALREMYPFIREKDDDDAR